MNAKSAFIGTTNLDENGKLKGAFGPPFFVVVAGFAV